MKKLADVLVIRKEEDASLGKRRDDYALKRDLQALDNNDAITRKLNTDAEVKTKCVKCGKEFSHHGTSEDFRECPQCRQ